MGNSQDGRQGWPLVGVFGRDGKRGVICRYFADGEGYAVGGCCGQGTSESGQEILVNDCWECPRRVWLWETTAGPRRNELYKARNKALTYENSNDID